MSCGVGRRHSLDLALLWLWSRSVAIALIGPLAWEPAYAASEAPKRPKTKQNKTKKQKNENQTRNILGNLNKTSDGNNRKGNTWPLPILSKASVCVVLGTSLLTEDGTMTASLECSIF